MPSRKQPTDTMAEQMVTARKWENSRMDDSEAKIHDVGVQVYRNVQAIVEKSQEKNTESFKELDSRLETLQYAVESKNKAVTPLVVITLLVALSDLVFNILRFLGVI